MQSALDQAITAAAAAEAAYNADAVNVATIQTNIAAASNGLAPAQAQQATDAAAAVAAYQALSAAALAAAEAIAAPPTTPAA